MRAINTLVTTYRAKYPSLKYVVLLGTDTALPMWRQQDLNAVSPEVDEANDLAFTTNGLDDGQRDLRRCRAEHVPDEQRIRRIHAASVARATTSRCQTWPCHA